MNKKEEIQMNIKENNIKSYYLHVDIIDSRIAYTRTMGDLSNTAISIAS